MPNNLIISYDLMSPGQKYENVAKAIRSLGSSVKVHQSLWYVRSNYSAEEAAGIVQRVLDGNDKLFVAEVQNAYWYNLDAGVGPFMQGQWYS